jgi:hypothetical protein
MDYHLVVDVTSKELALSIEWAGQSEVRFYHALSQTTFKLAPFMTNPLHDHC